MIEIVQAATPKMIEEARTLFREYQEWFGLNLCFQNFDDEVAGLPGKYAPPEGRLFIAYVDGVPAGCIGLRKLDEGVGEMKRLFVKEEFRGMKIGKLLLETFFEDADYLGYHTIRLDTYPPKMGKAVEMYRSYGFYEIEPYYHNPYGETLYMERSGL